MLPSFPDDGALLAANSPRATTLPTGNPTSYPAHDPGPGPDPEPDPDPHPSPGPSPDPGRISHITAGHYAAEVGGRGAALRALTLGGRDLVVRQSPELSLLAYSGRVLAPWPNRLRDGEYWWEGTRYRVPVTEAATNTALHGLLCWTDFVTEEVTDSWVTLGAVVDDPAYPSRLEVRVTFSLDPSTGLTVRVSATNTGVHSAPYGVSYHPYLTVGAPAEECILLLPAERVLRVDNRMLPVRRDDVADETDLREPRLFGQRRLDHTFTGLPQQWGARLRGPDGFVVALDSDTPWCQVYSGEEIGRIGIAVEPMTCPPDALTSRDGLIVLAPGASHVLTFSIHSPGGSSHF